MANQVTGLVATAVSTSEIDLYWDDVATLTGEVYDVERDGLIVGNDYAGTHTVGSPYQDTGLSPGTAYTYRVRAVNGTEPGPPLTGLVLWYKADTITGLTDGEVLTASWADGSGNANDATIVVGREPTYKTAGGSNSLPYVMFPAADVRQLAIPNVLSGVLTAGTLFAVIKVTSLSTSGSHSHLGSGVDGLYTFSNGLIYEKFGTNTRKDAITPGTTMTNWHIYTVRSASGLYDIRQNGGTVIYTTASNTVAWQTTPRLGGAPDLSSNANSNGIAEYLVYNSSLSLADTNLVGAYLGTKYAITWTTAT